MSTPIGKLAVSAAAIASLTGISAAHAGAIFVPGYGPQAQARAGAFMVKADDVSALVHNPAGLAGAEGNMLQLGSNFISMSLSFQREGTYRPTGEDDEPSYVGEPFPEVTDQTDPAVGFAGFQAVPLIGFATDLGDPDSPLRLAAGVITPHGFPERNFAADYEFSQSPAQGRAEAPPPQRYDVMEQAALKGGPTVGAAYQITDDLDVGGRFTWGIAHISARAYVWGIRNYEEYIGRDGYFDVEGWDYFVPNFGLGARYRPSSSWEIGASYSSSARASAQGEGAAVLGYDLGFEGEQDFIRPVADDEATCAPGGELDALKTCVTFKLPQSLGAGARWIWEDEGRERADIEFDIKWENWSSGTASDYELIVDGESGLTGLPMRDQRLRHHFRDTFSFRLGGSYLFPMGDGRGLVASAGAAYDTAAAPTQYTRLDIDGNSKTTLAAGLSYVTPRLRVDAGGGAVLQPDRRVEACQTDTSQPSCDGGDSPPTMAQREQPDPIQPLRDRTNQFQSPFNAGEYSSGYTLMSVGVTTWF